MVGGVGVGGRGSGGRNWLAILNPFRCFSDVLTVPSDKHVHVPLVKSCESNAVL